MSTPADQMQAGIAGAVEEGVRQADGNEIPQAEIDLVQKTFKEYQTAREFDLFARQQQERDRRYAQGIANPTWASDANIIGSFIDILQSFLYAKDPDVSVRPAPRATGGSPIPTPDPSAENNMAFAETSQIVISQQWRKARLKRAMRRVLRSSLSVGPGWFKALMYSDTKGNPQLEKELGDAQDNLKKIQAKQEDLINGDSDGDAEVDMKELEMQIEGLQAKVEASKKRGLCIDFVRSEDIQVSLDVPSIADYRDADWMSHDLFVQKCDLKARFPLLTDNDIKTASVYYLRQTGQSNPDLQNVMLPNTILPLGAFIKSTDNPGMGSVPMGGQDKPVEFVKVVEMWDHRDCMIKTMVDGVKRWAIAPYPPPQASTRFYPFFLLALFEVDGARYPQSLSWRMWKLQDEYSSRRSSGRKMRERSIPGTVFDSGMLDPEEAKKISQSVEQEFVGIRTTTPGVGIDKIVAAKPIARIDPAIYDTKDVLYDMNVVSGVQEAQASGQVNVDTATAADYQAEGFASRTGADRDIEEDMLTDFAQYTLQVALQSLSDEEVKRIAGPLAFWPVGMEVDDILNTVEVEIKAGTTGKPQARADKEAWATLLPLMTNMIAQIQMAEATGTPQGMQMAQTQKNLLRETLKRLDDRMSLESILAPLPAPVGMPGMPGAPATSAAPGAAAPPGAPAPAGAPPVGNGTVNNPVAQGAPPV